MKQIVIPIDGQNSIIDSIQNFVIVGANGSGKSHLGAWIETKNKDVLRISAQRALNVPIEYLKTLEEDAPSVVFESITNDVHDNKEGVTVPGYSNNQTNAFSPIDKITELYERLLKEKDEKYAALEQRIQNLEKQK